MPANLIIPVVVVAALIIIPFLVTPFLRTVEAGSIRMVSWLGSGTKIYRGPGKSYEIPLLTTGTTISSRAINVDLDITDQTADLDDNGSPQPIKVRVLASAIVSVGDSDQLIKTGANRFFSKPEDDQTNILIDLLSSSARRAINLLTHDQLFSAKTAPRVPVQRIAAEVNEESALVPVEGQLAVAADEDDDPLAIIIRKACSRELTDLGLIFNSLNIKVVQSEVADARRRQSAAEAQANADIVTAQQARRAKEAQLEAERYISDKQRDLEQTIAANAALIADAEAKKQFALAGKREAELKATDIAQASADAERVRIGAQAKAEAEAIQIRTIAEANADGIRLLTDAIRGGGPAYFQFRQIEMLPEIVPYITQALAQAKLVTIAGGNGAEGAAGTALDNITGVIQTVLAAQLVARNGILDATTPQPAADNGDTLPGTLTRS